MCLWSFLPQNLPLFNWKPPSSTICYISDPLKNQWTSDQDNDPTDSHHSSACESSPQHSYPSSSQLRPSFPPHISRPGTKEFVRDRIRSTSYRETKNKKEFRRQHRRNSVGEDNSLVKYCLESLPLGSFVYSNYLTVVTFCSWQWVSLILTI